MVSKNLPNVLDPQPASKEFKAALRFLASSVFAAARCRSWRTWSFPREVLNKLNAACRDAFRALETAFWASKIWLSCTCPVASAKKASLFISNDGSLPLMWARRSPSSSLTTSKWWLACIHGVVYGLWSGVMFFVWNFLGWNMVELSIETYPIIYQATFVSTITNWCFCRWGLTHHFYSNLLLWINKYLVFHVSNEIEWV